MRQQKLHQLLTCNPFLQLVYILHSELAQLQPHGHTPSAVLLLVFEWVSCAQLILVVAARCLGIVSKPSNTAGRNSSGLASEIRAPRGATSLASPASANELIVSLHSMQDQLDKLENTQKSILAHQRESDLHAERLDSKLDSIASVIVKIDRRMAAQH
jgi:hypothetical protein